MCNFICNINCCKMSSITVLHVLPPTNQTCLAKNEVVAGCKELINEQLYCFATKSIKVSRFIDPCKLLQQVKHVPCMALFPCKMIHSKVSIHPTGLLQDRFEREQLSRDEDKPCWWIPFGFPRRKWIPLIDRHMGLVNDVIYCDNLGKKWVPPY